MGMAIVTSVESAVIVAIRHSDTAPIASAAAPAWVRRDEAAGVQWPVKPDAPGDLFMLKILRPASESVA